VLAGSLPRSDGDANRGSVPLPAPVPAQRQPVQLPQGGSEMERDPVVAEPAFLVLAGDGLRPGGIAPVETVLIILDPRDRLRGPAPGWRRTAVPRRSDSTAGRSGEWTGPVPGAGTDGRPFGGGVGQHRPGIGQHRRPVALEIMFQCGDRDTGQGSSITPLHVQRCAGRHPLPPLLGRPPGVGRYRRRQQGGQGFGERWLTQSGFRSISAASNRCTSYW